MWPAREGYCLALVQGQGGGSSGCAIARSAPKFAGGGVLAPQLHCSSSWTAKGGTTRLRLAPGGVPTGELLGRAFFLAELPARRALRPVRVTALDGTGAAVGSWTLGRCG